MNETTRWSVLGDELRNPCWGAEIGVWHGRGSAYWLTRFKSLQMICVDPWEKQPNGADTYENINFAEQYETYKKTTKAVKNRITELRLYSVDAAQHVETETLDFVFIDAQHDYQSVLSDIKTWTPKVKPGGIVFGHDYASKFPGVIQAVEETGTFKLLPHSVWMRRV